LHSSSSTPGHEHTHIPNAVLHSLVSAEKNPGSIDLQRLLGTCLQTSESRDPPSHPGNGHGHGLAAAEASTTPKVVEKLTTLEKVGRRCHGKTPIMSEPRQTPSGTCFRSTQRTDRLVLRQLRLRNVSISSILPGLPLRYNGPGYISSMRGWPES
jgi:hypothetical protein